MYIKILGHLGKSRGSSKYPGLLPSCFIQYQGQSILIDSTPDVYTQLNERQIQNLTALLITHPHTTTVGGLSDVNSDLKQAGRVIPVYLEQTTLDYIERKFKVKDLTQFDFTIIQVRETFRIEGIDVRPLRIAHQTLFPTLAFNFDKVFLYSPYGFIGGSGIDEYELQYWSNNILAIIDGAYWDKQLGTNHTAVLDNFEVYMLLNNKYTYLTGYGSQWPSLGQAKKVLSDKLKNYKTDHPECHIQEILPITDGKVFTINMNKYLEATQETKPSLDRLLKHPDLVNHLTDQELLMLHYRCHQLYSKFPEIILQSHVIILKELFRRKFYHYRKDKLDNASYQVLGQKAKIFDLYLELPEEYLVTPDIIKIVGSSLQSPNPNDIDIIAPDAAEYLVKTLFHKYEAHCIGKTHAHGQAVNLYDLVLRKKPLQFQSTLLPDYTKSYSPAPQVDKLSLTGIDEFIIEPYIEGEYSVIVDKQRRLIYEQVVTVTGKTIITDFLAFKQENFSKEILHNRLFFMQKKWLDTLSEDVYLPHRWVVKSAQLYKFLAEIKRDIPSVIIRPANSYYSEGKFVLHLTKALTPNKIIPPLKATGTAYHELEYFDHQLAWEFFGKYYINKDGKVRVETKYDGLRTMVQYNGKQSLLYFEDAKKNRISSLPTIEKGLKTLGPVILDSELMEKNSSDQWVSRHDLLKWAIGKAPGSDENVRLAVFDILYYQGQDLHTLPLAERLEILNKIDLPPGFIRGEGSNCSTESEFISAIKKAQNTQGSDGAMLKSVSGDYPLTGKSLTWAKFKNIKEIDVIVLEQTKSGTSTFNYICGYQLPSNGQDKYTPTREISKGVYGIIGKTFNTKVNCEVGEIITIGVLEIKKKTVQDKIQYTWFHPRFMSKKPGKSQPDGIAQCERIYQAGTNPVKSFEELYIVKASSNTVEPQWTIQKGDKFKYSIQVHLRGLSEYQAKNLPIKKIGFEPSYFQPSKSDYKLLHSILDEDWEGAVVQATNEPASVQLQKLVHKVKLNQLSEVEQNVMARVSPISIHQDLRLVVTGDDFFEGGHWVTPGNQFKENGLLSLDNGKYVQFMIKQPHVGELREALGLTRPDIYDVDWLRGTLEPIVRGPASWLDVGSPTPLIVPPSGVGATPNQWAVFNRVEHSTGEAGRQTARSGSKHFKLFRFDGQILNGYIMFMYAPLGDQRIWVTMRPKNQARYAAEFEKPQSKFLDDVVDKVYQVLYEGYCLQK